METILLILAGLVSGLIIVLLLSWNLSFNGTILIEKDLFDYSTTILAGGKKSGIGFIQKDGKQFLFLGSPMNPFFKWGLSKKKNQLKKKSRRKPKKSISLGARLSQLKSVPFKKIISDVKSSVKWVSFVLNGTVGLNDPSITGQVYGAFTVISSVIPPGRYMIDIVPNFYGQRVDLDCVSAVKFRPAILTWRVGLSFMRKRH